MKSPWLGGALLGAVFSPPLLLFFYGRFAFVPYALSGTHSLTSLPPILDFCASVLVSALMMRWLSGDSLPRFGFPNALVGGVVSGFYGLSILTSSAGQFIYEDRDVLFIARIFTYAPLVFGALALFVVGAQSRLPSEFQSELRHRFLRVAGMVGGAVLLQWTMWGCLLGPERMIRFLPHASSNCLACIDFQSIATSGVSPKYLLVGAGLGFLSTALYQSRLRVWRLLSALYGVGLCLSIAQELRHEWLLLARFVFSDSEGINFLWIDVWFLAPPFFWGLTLAFLALTTRSYVTLGERH